MQNTGAMDPISTLSVDVDQFVQIRRDMHSDPEPSHEEMRAFLGR